MTTSPSVEIVRFDEEGIAVAARRLADGGLVIHPTETVVSLSGDPYAERAVTRARSLKGYAEPRPFLVLVRDPEAARALARRWPESASCLAEALWPGPLTLVVEGADDGPEPVVSEGRIAVRPASDPVSLALLTAFGGPIFSTSANRRGSRPPTVVTEAIDALGLGSGESGSSEADPEPIVAVESAMRPGRGGPSEETPARPSTVVDVTSDPPRVVRRGAIPAERIRTVAPGTVLG